MAIIIPNEEEKKVLGVSNDSYYLKPEIQSIIQNYVNQEKISKTYKCPKCKKIGFHFNYEVVKYSYVNEIRVCDNCKSEFDVDYLVYYLMGYEEGIKEIKNKNKRLAKNDY